MKYLNLRLACLCVAFLSPLAVTSCTVPASSLTYIPGGLPAQNCSGCVIFNIKAWSFTPAKGGDIEDVLRATEHLSYPMMNTGSVRVIQHSHVDDILGLLRQKGEIALQVNASSITAPDQPLPFLQSSPSGEFRAVLTAGPEIKANASRVVNFDISSEFTPNGVRFSNNQFSSSGRILLPTGAALLNIQQVRLGYIIWIIQAN